MQKPRHILVLRFSAMGDVAMIVPVLRAILDQNPEVKITVVTREFFKPIFNSLQNVEVFAVDFTQNYQGILGLYRLSKDLRALNFDVVADLHNVLRTKILKLFFTGRHIVQLDKGRSEKKALVKGQRFEQLQSTHERYADVFRNLGIEVNLSKPSFPAKEKLINNFKKFISNPDFPRVGVAPFAAYPGKMYPLELMKQVIEELSKSCNIILFGGGDGEIAILTELESGLRNVKSVAGKLSLEEELMLISNLDLMLSMDSANGHLAAIYNVDVVTIWGVTHPYAGFSPFNQAQENQLRANRKEYPMIPTSIYGNKYPISYENAAGSISPSTIVNRIKSLV